MLKGRNIIVLDLETAKAASDCLYCGEPAQRHGPHGGIPACSAYEAIGWNRHADLGISIGCYYDYQDGQLYWFDRVTLADTVRYLVQRMPILVSFNGRTFDFPLMEAVTLLEVEIQPSLYDLCATFRMLYLSPDNYDVLHEIWIADPERKFERGLNSLDVVSQANGYGAKEIDGNLAPQRWRAGHYAAVLNYCAGDVRKTRQLFEQIVTTGHIKRGDGYYLSLRQPQA